MFKRKLLHLLLVLALLFTGCAANGEVAESTEKPDKLKILLYRGYEPNEDLGNGVFTIRKIGRLFEEATGIGLECVEIEANSQSEYAQKLNTMLMGDDGPDMFVLSKWGNSLSLSDLVDSDVVMDISDRLENYDGLVEGVKNDYYFPVGMWSRGYDLRKEQLDRIGYSDLKSVSDYEQFTEIYIKWLEEERPPLNSIDFSMLLRSFDYEIKEYFDFDENINLSNKGVRDTIKKYAGYFDEKYLEFDNKWTVEDIKKLVLDDDTQEFRAAMDEFMNRYDNYVVNWDSYSHFNVEQIEEHFLGEDVPYLGSGADVLTTGLVVNRTSKYRQYSIQFIDYMISEDMQREVVAKNKGAWLPMHGVVNQECYDEQMEEDKIVFSDEAIELKETLYERINSGDVKLFNSNIDAGDRYRTEIMEIFIEYVFGDDRDEEALTLKLRKLNNELFMMINE